MAIKKQRPELADAGGEAASPSPRAGRAARVEPHRARVTRSRVVESERECRRAELRGLLSAREPPPYADNRQTCAEQDELPAAQAAIASLAQALGLPSTALEGGADGPASSTGADGSNTFRRFSDTGPARS